MWYDELEAQDNVPYFYEFKPPINDGDIYMTVETYSYNIVPKRCTTDTVLGYYGESPWVYFEVTHGNHRPSRYYWDFQHNPIMTP